MGVRALYRDMQYLITDIDGYPARTAPEYNGGKNSIADLRDLGDSTDECSSAHGCRSASR